MRRRQRRFPPGSVLEKAQIRRLGPTKPQFSSLLLDREEDFQQPPSPGFRDKLIFKVNAAGHRRFPMIRFL